MTSRIVLIVSVCLLSVLAVWQQWRLAPAYFTKHCFSDLHYTDESSDHYFSFTGGVVFDFYSNRTGVLTVTGKLMKGDMTYGLSRFTRFNYRKSIGNNYMMTFTSENPTPHDDIPDEMAGAVLKMLGLTGEHSMYLQAHSDNFITIGNSSSPFLTCVIKP